MSSTNTQKGSIHFIGIGGIGMSGLAQMYRWAGYEVSGSDRALNNPENRVIFEKLEKQGIKIFPQDGSFIKSCIPDLMVYSTAIESDNPDFIAGKDLEKKHRANALEDIVKTISGLTSIAVTGSCGKTTSTAWLGETLFHLGFDPVILNGGMINRFRDETYTGNFRPGNGRYFVYEADESDKSLVNFVPDYSLILNIGTDHYSKEELIEVFETMLRNTKKGAVIEQEVFSMLHPSSYLHLKTAVVSLTGESSAEWTLLQYAGKTRQISLFKHFEEFINFNLSQPGIHNAGNALSIGALIKLVEPEIETFSIFLASEKFTGVGRRFEKKGLTNREALIIDDYAHNIEKIVSCIKTAQDICDGRVFAVFQPHGYAPFKFMKDLLYPELEKTLREQDVFILMPVFYAGGTSSFTPKSEDVCSKYKNRTQFHERYLYFENRSLCKNYLNSRQEKGDCILIMGARDYSLSNWAQELVTFNL